MAVHFPHIAPFPRLTPVTLVGVSRFIPLNFVLALTEKIGRY